MFEYIKILYKKLRIFENGNFNKKTNAILFVMKLTLEKNFRFLKFLYPKFQKREGLNIKSTVARDWTLVGFVASRFLKKFAISYSF